MTGDRSLLSTKPIAPADGYQELRTCIAERDADSAERMLRYLHGLA